MAFTKLYQRALVQLEQKKKIDIKIKHIPTIQKIIFDDVEHSPKKSFFDSLFLLLNFVLSHKNPKMLVMH